MANLKVNMSMTKNPMPEQDPEVRSHNFEEVVHRVFSVDAKPQ